MSVTFDRKNLYGPINANKIVHRQTGWVSNSVEDLKLQILKGEKCLITLDRVVVSLTDYPFITYDNEGYEYEHIYFYPAPYSYLMKIWIKSNGLKVGDLVKIVRDYKKGEDNFDGEGKRASDDIYKIIAISENRGIVAKNTVFGELANEVPLPYFAIKIVEKEIARRPFKNMMEFRPFRDNWFRRSFSEEPFRVDKYTNEGVICLGMFYGWVEFCEEMVFDDTGLAAGMIVE